MQFRIQNGAVDLSGEPILRQVNLEINTASKIGIVGRNGCGKTTLLKLIAGEYALPDDCPGAITVSGKPEIGMLSQVTFADDSVTMVEELRSAYGDILAMQAELAALQENMEHTQDEMTIRRYTSLLEQFTRAGGFYFEKEYEAAIRHFGFRESDKLRPLSDFSGGQRTKIAFMRLLLSKPDILLLDEPTNHLDIEAVGWLEEYLKGYPRAFAVVSHDRMFLDNTVDEIYEIEYGKTHRYRGGYSDFAAQKKANTAAQQKAYDKQQKEIAHLQATADRFRYKATKAAMAQSKLKQIDRIERIDAPQKSDEKPFFAHLTPDDLGGKDALSVTDLQIGYDRVLSTVNLEVKRGLRIGILGGNGLGKSTFLKTLMGLIPPLGGDFAFGMRVNVGYFDQQAALYKSEKTLFEDYSSAFPALSNYEVRRDLGAFLFSGEDVFKKISVLSGGERVRLALCKLFKRQPNFLILDEPTNHLDIIGKEALEEILLEYPGTLLFVSHDRYFLKKISDSLLVFSGGKTEVFPYGYEQVLSAHSPQPDTPTPPAGEKKKKSFTTPAKERSKKEKALKKAEEKIAALEAESAQLDAELHDPQNQSDYQRLAETQNALQALEAHLFTAMEEWEAAAQALEEE